MKIWSLQFLKPGTVVSARVAAPTDAHAVALFAAAAGIGPDVLTGPGGIVRRDVVLTHYCGERPARVPAVLRAVSGNGAVLVPGADGAWHEADQSAAG